MIIVYITRQFLFKLINNELLNDKYLSKYDYRSLRPKKLHVQKKQMNLCASSNIALVLLME